MVPDYVPTVLENLPEGGSVGVVKRGLSLHFLVNGLELNAAEESLPRGCKVGGAFKFSASLQDFSYNNSNEYKWYKINKNAC